eukprot:366363-Chlamydomonas_euryale.AAC.4
MPQWIADPAAAVCRMPLPRHLLAAAAAVRNLLKLCQPVAVLGEAGTTQRHAHVSHVNGATTAALRCGGSDARTCVQKRRPVARGSGVPGQHPVPPVSKRR